MKNWDHMKPEEKHCVLVVKNSKPSTEIKPERVSHITEDVGYWRKANHIHKWFVDNVQDGADDCKEYYVSEEKLQQLLDACQQVVKFSKLVKGKVANGYTYNGNKRVPIIEDGKKIKDPSVAMNLLPTTEGFFFGGTGYDEWYLKDVKDTIKIIEPLLKEEHGDIYYSSSW